MNINFFIISVISLVVGAFFMTKDKFWKYKTSEMLFASTLRAFLGALIIALIGVAILANEIKNIFHF